MPLTFPQRVVLRAAVLFEQGRLDIDPDTLGRLLLRHFPDAYADHPALCPTPCAPGSAEKIAVMAARASRGERLHHPSDAKGPPPVLAFGAAIRAERGPYRFVKGAGHGSIRAYRRQERARTSARVEVRLHVPPEERAA